MDFRTIVITGASSGIGAALARTLALLGRNTERLDAVAVACRAKGATCRTASTCRTANLDVRYRYHLSAFLVDVG
jgi:NADP-dependent 3-hydroxy acid dehydrogenase YdfG